MAIITPLVLVPYKQRHRGRAHAVDRTLVPESPTPCQLGSTDRRLVRRGRERRRQGDYGTSAPCDWKAPIHLSCPASHATSRSRPRCYPSTRPAGRCKGDAERETLPGRWKGLLGSGVEGEMAGERVMEGPCDPCLFLFALLHHAPVPACLCLCLLHGSHARWRSR